MAFFRCFSFIFLSLYLLRNASATVFTLENKCSYTVWPGTTSSSGPVLGDGGFTLDQGATKTLNPPAGWSGRFWGRTGCNFDNTGAGRCATGDCGGLRCTVGGATPTSLAEFTLNGDSGQDFYDVSLVDGYNVGIAVRPNGGSGKCQYVSCATDVNKLCPSDLQVTDSGSVVACKSACVKYNTEEYCCTGAHNTSQTCPPTNYSQFFKKACPSAYSYAYDDLTGKSSATVFTLENKCSYTVWPGTTTGNGAALGDGGFTLTPGATMQLNPPAGWSGRFWARTRCNFDNTGAGHCATGDCGGLKCTVGGATPVSLAEFTLNGDGGKDFYDVSLVDGYNVGIGIKPTNGNCHYAGCVADLNGSCPSELQVTDSGSVVACKSACLAFNKEEYCCTGAHNTAQTCSPSDYLTSTFTLLKLVMPNRSLSGF